MGFEFSISVRGNAISGRGGMRRQIIRAYIMRVTNVAATRARRDIKAYLPTQYMYLGHNGGDPVHNPIPDNAGELVGAIHWDRMAYNITRVSDDPVTYGAWIEGIDPKNLVVWPGRLRRGLPGRFEGYHAFRLETQVLQREIVDIAQQELPSYLGDLNV